MIVDLLAARWMRIWLVGLSMAALVGCAPEPTYGSFYMMSSLSESGSKQFELHGPARTHTEFESGNSYWLTLGLRERSSTFGQQDQLSFVFGDKPDTGSLPLAPFGKPQAPGTRVAQLSFDMGCAVPDWKSDTTVSSYWAFDSGTVRVASPRSRDGIAGSFRIFLHSQTCVSGDSARTTSTANPMLLSGTFETKPR